VAETVVIGNATLYHGDCREVLPLIADESVDIILTDPPYGHNNNDGDLISNREAALGKQPSRVDASAARPIANDGMDDMKAVVDSMLRHASRVLRHDSCCCCCCFCGGGGPKPTFAWLAERMDRDGLSFFHAVVWDKGGLGIGWRYRRNYELVMISHRKGGKLKWETTRKDAITANVVRIGKIIPQIEDHPTPKPVALFDHFLHLHGKPGDVVLDPFMGHAPVGVAALNAGLRYIGIECDEAHFAAACRRIDGAHRQGALFDPDPEQRTPPPAVQTAMEF
jgi:site-specific DNA-methyltransferase (adenine-specific)